MISFSFRGKQAIIRTTGNLADTDKSMLKTPLFKELLSRFVDNLLNNNSVYLDIFPKGISPEEMKKELFLLLLSLTTKPKEAIIKEDSEKKKYFSNPVLLHQMIDHLYNFWRGFERYLICYSETYGEKSLQSTPYRTFNKTIEKINGLVRGIYRDISENITGTHPRIYRQMAAGFQVGLITIKPRFEVCQKPYDWLNKIPIIRQVLIEPPLILNPPMNKRSGKFRQVKSNPLDGLKINPEEWLCFPAKVGGLLVNLYFNNKFVGLGTSLANLFEMAEDEDLSKKPDALLMFGVPEKHMEKYKDNKTVFFEDSNNNLLVGAVPDSDDYGYFGYVKKMMLTLHNIIMMKKGRMPVHGAMVRVLLKNGSEANVVLFGDSGAGKSESLEAFRMLAKDYLRDMIVIFDDMGSLELSEDGSIKAYGTEIGAFVRLDDLQPGFAFGNIDRAIIMSAHKVNARVVLPITSHKEILYGYPIDFFLYANNYEEIDKKHPIFEEISSDKEALEIFGSGARIAKGTTMEKGLVNTYFANIFGPTQYKELHNPLAKKYFQAMHNSNVTLGILRTRLGISGYETKGPYEAAKALLEIISSKKVK
jgi:hypothetical protein